jgi:hypothetical protein
MKRCLTLSNLVVYPLEVIFVATDDRQDNYLRDLVAVNQPGEKNSRAPVAERHHFLHKTMDSDLRV